MYVLNFGAKKFCRDYFRRASLTKCSNLKTNMDNANSVRMSPKRFGVQVIHAHVAVAKSTQLAKKRSIGTEPGESGFVASIHKRGIAKIGIGSGKSHKRDRTKGSGILNVKET